MVCNALKKILSTKVKNEVGESKNKELGIFEDIAQTSSENLRDELVNLFEWHISRE